MGGEGGIKWKVAEVEESDKQIKKVSEGEGDKADGGGKENKRIKVSRRRREKSSRGEKERGRERKGDGRRIPVDGKIVTSHCGVPYGTAADGSTLLAACRKRKLCQRRKTHKRRRRDE